MPAADRGDDGGWAVVSQHVAPLVYFARNANTDRFYSDCVRALAYLWGHPGATRTDVKFALHCSDGEAQARLSWLREQGLARLERDGDSNHGTLPCRAVQRVLAAAEQTPHSGSAILAEPPGSTWAMAPQATVRSAHSATAM